jgi:hypothetical protein
MTRLVVPFTTLVSPWSGVSIEAVSLVSSRLGKSSAIVVHVLTMAVW